MKARVISCLTAFQSSCVVVVVHVWSTFCFILKWILVCVFCFLLPVLVSHQRPDFHDYNFVYIQRKKCCIPKV